MYSEAKEIYYWYAQAIKTPFLQNIIKQNNIQIENAKKQQTNNILELKKYRISLREWLDIKHINTLDY